MLPIHYHGPLTTNRDLKMSVVLHLKEIKRLQKHWNTMKEEYERIWADQPLTDFELAHLNILRVEMESTSMSMKKLLFQTIPAKKQLKKRKVINEDEWTE